MDTAQETGKPRLGELARQTIDTCGGVLAIASPADEGRAAQIVPTVSTDEDMELVLACCNAQDDVPTIVMLTDRDTAAEWAEAAAGAGVPIVADPDMTEALEKTRPMPDDLDNPDDPGGWHTQECNERWAAIVKSNVNRARESHAEAREKAYEAQMQALHILPADGVADGLETLAEPWEPISTGLDDMDEALDGGLPSTGLVMLGAVSSAGKTALAVQIADHIAEATGREALYVACEQSARELVARSVSRLMMEQTDHGKGYEVCPSSDILRADKREKWASDRRSTFMEALGYYQLHIGPHMSYLEPKKQPTVKWIRDRAEAVAAHSKKIGRKPPVVFIDYLQLLASPDPHMSDKQAMDANVMSLRQMARDLHMCVVAISALNRASYSTGITMESFRESSTIEYSADLLLGLQPEGMRERMKKVSENKRRAAAEDELSRFKEKAVRDCELVVLKNRNGKIPAPILLTCYAASSRFVSQHLGKKLEEWQPIEVQVL